MHRSGTSALAGALHKLGADLGRESSWVHPAADNPRGFFEYEPVVDLDRDILVAFGGTWSSPPPLPPGWVDDERVTELRDRAAQLSTEIPIRMVVKDPRLSLVQPLWEAVSRVPASILCVRHPAAVAESLRVRNQFTLDEGLFLWFRYNAAARLNRPDAMVVEYESLLADPMPQLDRVAEHIGVDATAKTVEAAAATMHEQMAHHEGHSLPSTPIGAATRRLYDILRSEATLDADDAVALWARLVTELPWAGPDDREITRARRDIGELKAELGRLTQERSRQEARIRRLDTELRYALAAVDLVAVSETADLLRSRGSDPG